MHTDPPEPVHQHPDDHHGEHHDDHGGSFASRALWTVLLLLIGIGVGLWAAPRLAPLLPAGLAPVAAWLTPADPAQTERLVALEARIDEADARLAEIGTAPEATPEAAPVEDPRVAELADTTARLDAEIAALQGSVAEVQPADDAALRQRLDRLEAGQESQVAELRSLKDQISGTGLAASQQTEEAAERIDIYRAELEGLRSEVSTLSDRVGSLANTVDGFSGEVDGFSGEVQTLSTRLDEVAADAEERITAADTRAEESAAAADTARETAERQSALANVRAAVASGAPYSQDLYKLGTVPMGLSAAAVSGVVPLTQLRDRFPEAAHQAVRANAAATEANGIAARSRAFLGAQFASRSLSPKTGDAPDAVLSRMEEGLRGGDLEATLAEAEKLPPEARAAMDDWLTGARRRVEAETALARLSADPSATN